MNHRIFLTAMLAVKAITGTAAETNVTPNAASKPSGPSFAVRGYRIEGNTVLRPEQFSSLSNYTGEAVSLDRLREGLGELQLLYRNLGFATVGVTLPQQQLTNGYVRVKVVEGRLSDIKVAGNRYYSEGNVRRALPSLDTNVLLNTKWFQPELDRANANVDRQIYPVISPGPEPSTTELTLKVKDRLPLHGHFEINNKATPDTPALRMDSSVQYNNLWQLDHQIGLNYNFSPQETKSPGAAPYLFDEPKVASYSGFYRLPIGIGSGLRDQYDRLPVDFGYDQVTHTFRLPPPTGNPELIVYASRSASETPLLLGPVTLITNTALADLSSQFAERDLTFNENLGTKLTIPLREFAGVRSSFTVGIDYKSYETKSYTTNLTYFDLYSLDTFGNRVLVTNQVIRLDSNSGISLHYLPISYGWSASRPDASGSTSFSFSQNVFLSALASSRERFEAVAGTTNAGGNYTTISSMLLREQKIHGDWSALIRAGGQWASAPVIGNEQFALGGTAGVRGYQEGESYGDTGWRVQFDLRAPPVNVGYFPGQQSDIPADLRCSWFMDYGEAYLIDRAVTRSIQQWGTGAGFYLTVGPHIDARLTLAWALRETPLTLAGKARAYFSVGVQF